MGGEISKYAQIYAKEALGSLVKDLEEQAITIEFEAMDWDVCDPFSNTDLTKHMTLRSQNCATKLLVLANFSGFLQRNSKWKEANRQFEELFRHSREENSIAIWIEPNRNDVTSQGGFIPRLIQWFKRKFAALLLEKEGNENQNSYAQSVVKVKHPLNDGTFRTTLVVVQFDLPLRRKL